MDINTVKHVATAYRLKISIENWKARLIFFKFGNLLIAQKANANHGSLYNKKR